MRTHNGPNKLFNLSRLFNLAKLTLRNMDITKLNLFILCKFLRHVGKVMVLVVLGLVGTIWYSVVANAFAPGLGSHSAAVVAGCVLGLLAYTAVVAMIVWSYLAAFLTDPGTVPPGWTPFPDEEAAVQELAAAEQALLAPTSPLQQQQQQLQPLQPQQLLGGAASGGGLAAGRAGSCAPGTESGREFLERPRFCKKCQAWKPPRAHHCSMTGRCVLKMDHYCVWVLNCVGLLNYKYFVLFLGYTFLGCLASAALLVRPCIEFFSAATPPLGRTILAFITFVFSAAFTLALLGFLIMHLRLVFINHTTIEAYEKRPVRPWPYNLGRAANFEEVFGPPGWRRLVPMRTPAERCALLGRYLGGGTGGPPTHWGNGYPGREQQMILTSNDSEHTL